jgi:hypothetical protein
LNTEATLKINNDFLKQVLFIKFLGVIIDQNLAWKNQISSVLQSVMKSTGLIAKLRHFTNRNTLKLIYYASAYPYLTYGNLVWGNTYPTRLQRLMNVQKKIVRLICFKSYTDHSEPLFLDLKILNIYKINDYLCSIYSCIVLIIVKIYQTSIVITLSKIMNFTAIIHVIPPSYTLATKELITANILSSTKASLYGIVLMKISKILIHISLLRKKQNYII